MLLIIIFGSLGGITGPAIQSIIAGEVESSEQGKIQGALTSLMSLTNIFAPLIFTAGLFSYFTSEEAFISVPGSPFLVGSLLIFIAMLVAVSVFKRHPKKDQQDLVSEDPSEEESSNEAQLAPAVE